MIKVEESDESDSEDNTEECSSSEVHEYQPSPRRATNETIPPPSIAVVEEEEDEHEDDDLLANSDSSIDFEGSLKLNRGVD